MIDKRRWPKPIRPSRQVHSPTAVRPAGCHMIANATELLAINSGAVAAISVDADYAAHGSARPFA